MSIADELQKLQQLHESGAISDEEFAKAKARLLDGTKWSGFESLWAATPSSSRVLGDAAHPCLTVWATLRPATRGGPPT